MESMTGYARAEGSTPQFSYSIEIKSLNNKYLETYVNLPRSLSSEELYFVELLKKHFVRGKVELGVELFGWSAARGSSIDDELLKRYDLFGSDPKGLYDLDREYQTRVFVAPTMPM